MHHTYSDPHIPWHIICMNIYRAHKHISPHTHTCTHTCTHSSNISREEGNKCVFLCIWILYKVPCIYIDMNSPFILSGCAVSDFLHFTGQPAVQLHYTCTVQFVSKRFPKLWNILSAAWPAHRSASAQGAGVHTERMAPEKKNVSCLEPRTSGPTHHCHCSGVVLKINGCMLTRFDMLHKSSHLWSHDTAKQRKQQAILAKMSDANKSTTICHIVVTKCFGLWGLPWDGGDKKPGLRVLGRRKS